MFKAEVCVVVPQRCLTGECVTNSLRTGTYTTEPYFPLPTFFPLESSQFTSFPLCICLLLLPLAFLFYEMTMVKTVGAREITVFHSVDLNQLN